jgi:hypothetical protein
MTVRGSFEYDVNKIVIILNETKSIKFIDRVQRREVKNMEIANMSLAKNFCSIQPIPHFDYHLNPYIIIKDC